MSVQLDIKYICTFKQKGKELLIWLKHMKLEDHNDK